MNLPDGPAMVPSVEGVRGPLAAFGRAHPELTRLVLFGSLARGEAHADSDVDVVASFAPGSSPRGMAGFAYLDDLEQTLAVHWGRRVDLIGQGALESAERAATMPSLTRYSGTASSSMDLSQRQLDALEPIADHGRKPAQWVGQWPSLAGLGADWKAGEALRRCVEFIGEAATRLGPPFHPEHPEVPWRLAVGRRNRLVQGYDDVDDARLWRTASEDLPEL